MANSKGLSTAKLKVLDLIMQEKRKGDAKRARVSRQFLRETGLAFDEGRELTRVRAKSMTRKQLSQLTTNELKQVYKGLKKAKPEQSAILTNKYGLKVTVEEARDYVRDIEKRRSKVDAKAREKYEKHILKGANIDEKSSIAQRERAMENLDFRLKTNRLGTIQNRADFEEERKQLKRSIREGLKGKETLYMENYIKALKNNNMGMTPQQLQQIEGKIRKIGAEKFLAQYYERGYVFQANWTYVYEDGVDKFDKLNTELDRVLTPAKRGRKSKKGR